MAKLRRGRRIGGYGDTKPIPLPPGYTIYPSHLTYTRDMPGRSPRATGSRYSTVEPRTVTQPLHAPRVTKYAPWDIKHAHMRGNAPERTLNEHRGITYQHVKGTSPWPKSMIPPRGAVSTPPEYLGVKDPRNVFGSGDPSALTAIGSIEDIPEGIRQTAMYLPQEALLRGREEVLKHVGAELREAVEAIPMVPFYGSSWGEERSVYALANVNPLHYQGTEHDWGEGLAEWYPGFMEGQPGEPVAAHARVQYDPFPSSLFHHLIGPLGEQGPYASHKDESQFDVAEHTGAHETMHVLHQLYPGTGLIWGDKNLEDRFLSGGNPDKGDLGVAQLILDPIINKHNAGELLSTYEQKVYEYVGQIIYTGGQDSTVIHELWAEIGSMGPDRIPQNLMWAYPFFQQQSEKNGNAP